MAAEAHTYISDMRAKGRAEAYAESYAEAYAESFAEAYGDAVLLVLKKRGLTVTDAERQRVAGCVDIDQLEKWLDLAVTAVRVEEVFA
ncbi:hypothetical protein GCM10009677_18390 [Sphaerisporangium rubeum]|uniref:Flagellar biosynthesis/type III secretory pathway protein FliH n=1 Tax=Sphaerisporangium rubeum TaxID=321317 RepID=A0A7X0M8Z7_9ACTN|nr:hypothetical protein [Sphaerisporangium rubeum]MBB6475922.1 flagellar biosynthesis/type III secretory pathway protein FliH [Sphaerisporangium rubeum]